MTMREQVLEFMKKHDQGAQERFRIPSPDIALLRVRLIVEETAELCIALHENDVVKIMDACADLRYVVVGTGIAYGVDVLDHFGAGDGYLAHPKPMVSEVSRTMYFMRLNNRINEVLTIIHNSLNMLSFNEEREIGRDLREAIDEALREVAYFDAMFEIPGAAVFAEVHRSNMTKNKLDKHSKGGKVSKKGFTPPNFEQFLLKV